MGGRDELQERIAREIKLESGMPYANYSRHISELVLRVLDEFIGGSPEGQTVGRSDVYVGMRVKVVHSDDEEDPEDPPIGATGTIVLPDEDGCPGVKMDEPWKKFNKDRRGTYSIYLDVDHIVEIKDGGSMFGDKT